MTIDPKKTLAIIVGVENYDERETLHPLHAAVSNASGMYEALKNKIGIEASNIRYIIDVKNYSDLAERIETMIDHDHNWDLIIFYFSGHGIKSDDQSEYYLGTCTIRPSKPKGSGIGIEDLFADYLNGANLLMILDSCYSGKAFDFARSRYEYYIMASSTYREKSKYPLNEELSDFTRFLLQTINKGIKSAGNFLTIEEIFQETARKLEEAQCKVPTALRAGNLGNMLFVENFTHQQPAADAVVEVPEEEYRENDFLYQCLDNYNKNVREDYEGLVPAASTFQNRLNNLILKYYPYPIAYYLKSILGNHQEAKTPEFYKSLFDRVIAFLGFVLIDDLVDSKREYEIGKLVSLNITTVDPAACLEALKLGCAKFSGKLFIKEFTEDARFLSTAQEFYSLIQSGASADNLRRAAVRFIGDLAFLALYTLIAIRTIKVYRNYCPPIKFRHENSVLMGEVLKEYEQELVFEEDYLHNGTVLLFRRPQPEKISPLDEHLNLWPLVIDANGYKVTNSKPDLYLFSKIQSDEKLQKEEYMYDMVALKPHRAEPKPFRDINNITDNEKEKYFSTFMNGFKNFFA